MTYSDILARLRLPARLQSGLIVGFAITIFLIDVLVTNDIKIILLYCIVIATAPMFLKTISTSTIAGLLTVLIVFGYFSHNISIDLWPEVIGRLLTIITVWVIAYVMRNFSRYKTLERSIIETDSNTIIVTNNLGEIELSNPAATQLLGYKGSELARCSIFDLLPEDIQSDSRHSAAGHKGIKPQLIRHQTELVQKNGTRIPVEISTNLFRHNAKEYTTIILRDISSQKLYEYRLLREHALNENILKTTRCIMAMLDCKGNIICFNPYLEEISGYKLEDIKGKNWFDIFIPERDKARTLGVYNNTKNGLDTDGTVNSICTSDGRERVIIWANARLFDEDNNFISILCTGQDITDRQIEQEKLLTRTQQLVALSDIAQQALQQTEFRRLMQFILKYIIHSAAAAKVIYCELDADKKQFHTWSVSGILNVTFNETTIPVVSNGLAAYTLKQNRPVCIQDYPANKQIRKLTEINEEDYCSVLSVPVGTNESPSGVLCVYHAKTHDFNDMEINFLESVANILGIVTKKNQATDQLALLWREKTKLSRLNLIGELGSHIAHEINQPLTALMNYLESCKRLLHKQYGEIPEPIAGLIEKSIIEAERASIIIRNIRDYVESGQLNRVRENINTIIEDTSELLSPQLSARKIALTLELQPDLSPVNIDKMQIQQVLINVINNSFEAMLSSREKRIVITTSMYDNKTVYVNIHDSGPGVIPAMLNSDFRVLIDTQNNGLGIGLSICQSIITAHEGKCWFSETMQGGATFNFTLPVDE